MVLRKGHMMFGRLTVGVAGALLMTPAVAAGSACVYSEVSSLDDERIDESSSLAASMANPGIAYTANDEKGPVYAIETSTGRVVGTTYLDGAKIEDPEAMAMGRNGRLVLADIGDNDNDRDGMALYAFPEQAAGVRKVTATRFPIAYSDGKSHNAETLLISPTTGRKYIVTKVSKGYGAIYALPTPLRANTRNVATNQKHELPKNISDGTFTPDGAWVILRDDKKLYVLDPTTWTIVQTVSAPPVDKGESVTVRPRGKHLLVGSEGEESPLLRVAFDPVAGRLATR